MDDAPRESPKVSLDELMARVRAATRPDEEKAVGALLSEVPFTPQERGDIVARAHGIVSRSRAMSEERGTLDAFLQQFGLSNKEGVALMCLAEALLRIPDAETQDELISEKILSGDWATHKGRSESPFVNAGVWALMLTGRVVSLDREAEEDPAKWVGGMVARMGEPVIREATLQAMRIMGRQFVYGRTIREAMARQKKQKPENRLLSFDMLGEGARTAAAAERYFRLYGEAIDAVGAAGEAGDGAEQKSSVSVKLSALHPRYEEAQRARVMQEMLPGLIELAQAAKARDIGFTIDAEEADRLDLQLGVFEALAREPSLNDWGGLGLAVQAYLKRGPAVIDWLAGLARETGRRFPVRLVKGAYWDTEIKHAQVLGLADYPVWTRKANTDVAYLVTAARMLAVPEAIYSQFATHNAHTLSAIHHMGREARDRQGRVIDFEYQRLHGMASLFATAARAELGEDLRFRVYAPVGRHEDLLPYLVRRLLENGANSSFVNRFMDAEVPVEEVVRDPFAVVEGFHLKRHHRIPVPREIYGDRANSAGVDLTNPAAVEAIEAALEALAGEKHEGASIVAGRAVGGEAEAHVSPADNADIVGEVRSAAAEDIERALGAADKAAAGWDALGGTARAEILEAAANLIEEDRAVFLSILAREGGKTIPDGIAEVREAADMCRYYALEARKHFAEPESLKSPTGESNELSLHGRGVFACISPWNFPLAIFTGQITAALAAGNAVIAKPAGQTPLIATRMIRLLHRAGIPADVLHLLIGSGSTVGAALTEDPRIAGVAFTGSTDTGRRINRALAARDAAIAPLVAETGGQNAMIVDSSALTEQVSDDVMISAFGSAGQRCSSLRVLYLQESVADKTLEMLTGALKERRIGHPALLKTDIGPVIDAAARDELQAHIDRMMKEAKLIARADLPPDAEKGSYLAPHIFEIPSLSLLTDEVFGPILHVIRYKAGALDEVIADIRATGFGLTFGVHSRLERRWLDLFRRAPVGNAYVNRNMIGAVVGVQPFGGMGLSGTGPKAGGPHYLFRFATEKVLTVNTAAIGGNTDLFRLQESGEENA